MHVDAKCALRRVALVARDERPIIGRRYLAFANSHAEWSDPAHLFVWMLLSPLSSLA